MLSIISITKNDAIGIGRTIDSTYVLRSQFSDVEHIVIDGSDKVIADQNERYCNGQVNVKYLVKEPKGISDAFNAGIQASAHKWLWFLNGGDQLSGDLDLVLFTGLLKSVQTDLLIFQIKSGKSNNVVQFPPANLSFPPVKTWIPHPATIINRSFFNVSGFFDTRYKIAMDYDLWIRAWKHPFTVNMISMPVAVYDETGVSSTQTKLVFREGAMIIRKNFKDLFFAWLYAGRLLWSQYRFFKTHSRNGN